MTFIERHISILAAAVFGMIVIRIFMSTEANGFNVEGFQGGFMQYRTWLSSASEPALTPQSDLADLISSAISRKRSVSSGPVQDYEIITGSTGAQGEKNSEKQNAEKPPAAATGEGKAQSPAAADAKPESAASPAEPVPAPVPIGAPQQGDGERTVLERLGLRRSELDKREEEIANREAMLQAAEKRLLERSEELKKLEVELKKRIDQHNAELMSLKPIVTIYETMKPKDAARVFEKMEFSNLQMVAGAMNPRKLSDVLSQMDPAMAGKLTKSMSAQSRAAALPAPLAKADTTNELPDLNSQGTP